jgi:hypothetical protein
MMVARATWLGEQQMKNIQVIDGARNCVYDIFQVDDDDFAQLFGRDTDIAFAEDFEGRDDLGPVFERIWRGRIPKAQTQGIHGTYFVGLEDKKAYYPTRRDEEAINPDGTRLR